MDSFQVVVMDGRRISTVVARDAESHELEL
jgi:cytidylate kinase